mmetsp:Transcript_39867/g.119981  ORF Transcript_39867/g.119981 Transcript_39867/m.119981 type:complete len:519 (+) Transcript_39867:594-2150(+)
MGGEGTDDPARNRRRRPPVRDRRAYRRCGGGAGAEFVQLGRAVQPRPEAQQQSRQHNVPQPQQVAPPPIIVDPRNRQKHGQRISPLTFRLGWVLLAVIRIGVGGTATRRDRDHDRISVEDVGGDEDEENIVDERRDEEDGGDLDGVEPNEGEEGHADGRSHHVLGDPIEGVGRRIDVGEGDVDPRDSDGVAGEDRYHLQVGELAAPPAFRYVGTYGRLEAVLGPVLVPLDSDPGARPHPQPIHPPRDVDVTRHEDHLGHGAGASQPVQDADDGVNLEEEQYEEGGGREDYERRDVVHVQLEGLGGRGRPGRGSGVAPGAGALPGLLLPLVLPTSLVVRRRYRGRRRGGPGGLHPRTPRRGDRLVLNGLVFEPALLGPSCRLCRRHWWSSSRGCRGACSALVPPFRIDRILSGNFVFRRRDGSRVRRGRELRRRCCQCCRRSALDVGLLLGVHDAHLIVLHIVLARYGTVIISPPVAAAPPEHQPSLPHRGARPLFHFAIIGGAQIRSDPCDEGPQHPQ